MCHRRNYIDSLGDISISFGTNGVDVPKFGLSCYKFGLILSAKGANNNGMLADSKSFN
jgi:hypothetical protein